MSGVKSKPIYSPLAANPRARFHVLLAAGEGALVSLTRVLNELRESLPEALPRCQVLCADVPSEALASFQTWGLGGVSRFGDTPGLLLEIQALLGRSLMGTHLYIAGPESFIGRVLQIGLRFNLNKDEIGAEHVGSAARRVRCVHCRTDIEEVATNIVQCGECGRWLQVRDHYSRRFAAYMGVMVDAEAPGERPPLQEIHR